jgi:hypothetical protein
MIFSLNRAMASTTVGISGFGLAYFLMRTFKSELIVDDTSVYWLVAGCAFAVCFAGSITCLGFMKETTWRHTLLPGALYGAPAGGIVGTVGGFSLLPTDVGEPPFFLGTIVGIMAGAVSGLVLSAAFGWTVPRIVSRPTADGAAMVEPLAGTIVDIAHSVGLGWMADAAEEAASSAPVPLVDVRMSQVYRGTCQDSVVASADLEFLSRALKCNACELADEAARSAGNPWCMAPNPPEIRSLRCSTFLSRYLSR